MTTNGLNRCSARNFIVLLTVLRQKYYIQCNRLQVRYLYTNKCQAAPGSYSSLWGNQHSPEMFNGNKLYIIYQRY